MPFNPSLLGTQPISKFNPALLGSKPSDPIGLTTELEKNSLRNVDPYSFDIDSALGNLKQHGSDLVGDMSNFANTAWGAVKAGGANLAEGVGRTAEGLSKMGQPIGTVGGEMGQGGALVMAPMGLNPEGTLKTLGGLGQIVATPAIAALNMLKPQTDLAISGYKQAYEAIPENIRQPVTDTLKTVWNAIPDKIKETAGDAFWAMGLAEAEPFAKAAVKGVKSIGESITGATEKGILDAWKAPTVTARGFKQATKIYENAASSGNDISKTLMENKLNPSDHINGKNYSTSETADQIRQDAGSMSRDALRPALAKADVSVPRTPVNDVIQEAIKKTESSRFLTSEEKIAQTKKLEETYTALQDRFPDGMSLTEMHDEKILRDSKAKYSPVGDIATNAEATKNKTLADSFREIVENKAPKEIPVKDFNKELTKQYQAADYLDALHGKPAPKNMLTKVAGGVAKLVGAGVGETLGGGIISGLAGYKLGGMVENLIMKLPNPLKSSFLENLKVANPEAFTKVQDYLKGLSLESQISQPKKIINKKTSIE